MRKVTRAHCRRQQHRILVDEEGSYDEDQLTSSWALVRDQAPRGIHCSPVCLRHARGINPAETPAGPSWGHYGPSALPVPAGTGEGSSMGPVEETGTVMKRMSTLAGMAAPPASASLSVASFSAGDSTGTGSATVAETRRRVDRPVRRPVHRHVGADGPDRQGGAQRVAGRGQPHPVCGSRGSSPTSPAPSVSPPCMTVSGDPRLLRSTRPRSSAQVLCLDCSAAPCS